MEELKKALLLIKHTCEHNECQKCPLSKSDECLVNDASPSEWTILNEKIVKLLI